MTTLNLKNYPKRVAMEIMICYFEARLAHNFNCG